MLDIRKVDSRFADGESGAQDRRIFPLRTTLKRIWQGRSGRLFASSVVSASMPSMPSTTSTYSALQLPSTSHQDDDNDRQKPYVNAYDPNPLPKGEREPTEFVDRSVPHSTNKALITVWIDACGSDVESQHH